MNAAGSLAQLGLAYSLFTNCALRCLQLSTDLLPNFAHELLIHYKFYAFLTTASRLSHTIIGVNSSNLYYFSWLCCCSLLFLRVTFALLIVTMSYIPFTTLILHFVIKRFVGNSQFLLWTISLLSRTFFLIGEVQRKTMFGGGLISKWVLLCACFLFVIDELALCVYEASLIGQLQFLKGRWYIIRLAVILRCLI